LRSRWGGRWVLSPASRIVLIGVTVIELIEFGVELGFDRPAAIARVTKKSAKRAGNYSSRQKMSQIKKSRLVSPRRAPSYCSIKKK
jgi:hypothetical protein